MEQWGGLCCIGAAALYLLSRETARDVDFLNSATRVEQLKDLESRVVPSIIAVSGTVGSETPIKSEHSGILSVILEETAEQHFLKRNWKFSWVQDTALILPVSKEVPWFLDDGTGRVNVEGAQSAIGFALTTGGEVLEKPEPSSLVRGTLDYLRGLKMLGIRRIERVLPVGTRLTVVGQTIKDGVGDVKIQKPDEGPFYVSPVPLDQLISKVGKWSRRFKKASMGLALVGVILISKPVIKYILVRTRDLLVWRRQQRLSRRRVVDEDVPRRVADAAVPQRVADAAVPRRVADAAVPRRVVDAAVPRRVADAAVPRRVADAAVPRRVADAAVPRRVVDAAVPNRVADEDVPRRVADAAFPNRVADAGANREERVTRRGLENSLNGTSRDEHDRCVVCLERKCNAAFVQCGHMCCCISCSLKLQGKPCPLCRKPGNRVLKIYRN